MRGSLTVLFEDPFWIGLYERWEDGRYTVSRIVFGAEPKDYEVDERLRKNWTRLRFSPPVPAGEREEKRINPKRMQREIRSQASAGIGTKAQQALKAQQEQKKTERKEQSRLRREEEKERRYALHREKKRARHRGK